MNFLAKYFFILSLLLATVVSNAQVTITGSIVDAHTKEPVSYASVYLQKSGLGQTSDSAGNFKIHINNLGNDSLVVTYVGY